MKSCQQDILNTSCARALKLGVLYGDDKKITLVVFNQIILSALCLCSTSSFCSNKRMIGIFYHHTSQMSMQSYDV